MRAASRQYLGKNCNVEKLADALEEYFETHGYVTQSAQKGGGYVIQARKEGFLRDLLAADRAFTVTLTGKPEDFTVSFGIGKWVQNLAMATLEGVALVPILFFVEVPISLWSYEIEREFWSYVEQQVELRV